MRFEACWTSQFWLPFSVQTDDAFRKGEFRKFINERDISFRPVFSRRQGKNSIESKNGDICCIVLKL